MSKFLIITGILLAVVGLFWPWLQKIPFGRLPGDFSLHRETFHFYFPLTTSIIISVIISLLFWLFKK